MVNGGFAYKDLFISQHPNVCNIFQSFLNNNNPSQILEIGTMHGGLTLMIKDILDNIGLSSTSIKTYDIENQEFLKPLVIGTNTEVITENLFDHYYRYFRDEQTKNKITQYIQQEGLTIVLCDGGCKKCEYNILAPLLKTGDIIMAHDYAPDRDFFEKHMKNQIWDWMEIEDKNIKDISEKYNLIPYNQEEMLSIAWNCRKKI
jgi:spore coat polysaccharide biosynthesis protein SpsF (cytidylyltransferase family)